MNDIPTKDAPPGRGGRGGGPGPAPRGGRPMPGAPGAPLAGPGPAVNVGEAAAAAAAAAANLAARNAAARGTPGSYGVGPQGAGRGPQPAPGRAPLVAAGVGGPRQGPGGPLQAPAAAQPAANPWTEHRAPDGRTYFYNRQTGTSSWTRPPELGGAALAAAPAPAPAAAAAAAGGATAGAAASAAMVPGAAAAMSAAARPAATAWKEYRAPDGRAYYYNAETKESRWTIPDELAQAQAAAQGAAPALGFGVAPGAAAPTAAAAPAVAAPAPNAASLNNSLNASLNASLMGSAQARVAPAAAAGAGVGLAPDGGAGAGMAAVGAAGAVPGGHGHGRGSRGGRSLRAAAAAGGFAVPPGVLQLGPPIEYPDAASAKAAFRELLSDAGVDSGVPWEDVARAVSSDRRFGALRTAGERRAAFAEHVAQCKKEETERARKRRLEAKEAFLALLDRSEVLLREADEALATGSAPPKFSRARDALELEGAWQDVETEADRQELYEDWLADRRRALREAERRARRERARRLAAAVRALPGLDARTPWRRAREMLRGDPDLEALDPRDALAAFEEVQAELEREEAEERRRRREARRREERANRDAFRELLDSLRAVGMVNAGTRWRDLFDADLVAREAAVAEAQWRAERDAEGGAQGGAEGGVQLAELRREGGAARVEEEAAGAGGEGGGEKGSSGADAGGSGGEKPSPREPSFVAPLTSSLASHPVYEAVKGNREGSTPRELFLDLLESLEAEYEAERGVVERVARRAREACERDHAPWALARAREEADADDAAAVEEAKQVARDSREPWLARGLVDAGLAAEDDLAPSRRRRSRARGGADEEPGSEGPAGEGPASSSLPPVAADDLEEGEAVEAELEAGVREAGETGADADGRGGGKGKRADEGDGQTAAAPLATEAVEADVAAIEGAAEREHGADEGAAAPEAAAATTPPPSASSPPAVPPPASLSTLGYPSSSSPSDFVAALTAELYRLDELSRASRATRRAFHAEAAHEAREARRARARDARRRRYELGDELVAAGFRLGDGWERARELGAKLDAWTADEERLARAERLEKDREAGRPLGQDAQGAAEEKGLSETQRRLAVAELVEDLEAKARREAERDGGADRRRDRRHAHGGGRRLSPEGRRGGRGRDDSPERRRGGRGRDDSPEASLGERRPRDEREGDSGTRAKRRRERSLSPEEGEV